MALPLQLHCIWSTTCLTLLPFALPILRPIFFVTTSFPLLPSSSPSLCTLLLYSICFFYMSFQCLQYVNSLLALPHSLNSFFFIIYMSFHIFLAVHDFPLYHPLHLLIVYYYLSFPKFHVFFHFLFLLPSNPFPTLNLNQCLVTFRSSQFPFLPFSFP